MELWGGIECTVNRVGDEWYDQLALSGHRLRLDDLDRIAELGIRTLRYPVLWEDVAPSNANELQWQWADTRLARLRELAVAPILGLAHHGSGPRYTSLIEDSFAPGLADFAGRVAARFPWVALFTPVNEPLTTARFSGLYGLWFPHGRNDRCFARALLNQCRAIVLAMRAIRRSTPGAKLVQTEDLGTSYGTAHMRYQCDFDNERRWLTWDLLCGRVDRSHPLHGFLIASGISHQELAWFADNPCPPDIIGINHYVTSDRYLDERHSRYARRHVGGNRKERYADVEAVRVLTGEYQGFRVLQEAWQRYRLPIALTEVHLGCSREEQLRWCIEAWRAANAAAAAGCNVLAMTVWSLFGTYNWDTLLTQNVGSYEAGAFDVRAPQPRPTAIARLIPALASGAAAEPAASGAGWWQRPERLFLAESTRVPRTISDRSPGAVPPLLICGATGSLGRAILTACNERNLAYRAVDRSELNICDRAAVERLLAEVQPWALINAAGFVRVDEAEHRSAQCFWDNAFGAAVLAQGARDHDIPFLTFSSDLVFDGSPRSPLAESSATRPLNEYGRSKEAAERLTLWYPKTLCVRTAAFFGSANGDFVSDALDCFAAGRRFCAASDVIVSPTYLPDLVSACLELLIDRESGVFHLVNQGAVSWAEWARLAASALDLDCRTLQPRRALELGWTAARPPFSALTSERIMLMPSLENAVRRYALVRRSGFQGSARDGSTRGAVGA
jgi:dTDP-4-dehydrorhamnose reductase